MAETIINALDDDSLRNLAEDHRRLKHQVQNILAQVHNAHHGQPHEIFYGRTTTNEKFPTYPDPPANTFVVATHKHKFTEEPGEQAWDKDPSVKTYVARTVDGRYLPEGTDVVIVRLTTPIAGVRYAILDQDVPLVPIELVEKLELGGTCLARRIRRVGTTAEFEMYGEPIRVRDMTHDTAHEPGKWIGAPTYRGWATAPSAGPLGAEWLLINLEQVAEIIQGTTVAMLNPLTQVSENAMVTAFYNGKDPGSTQHLYDPQELFRWMLPGARFTARRNDKVGDGAPASPTVPSGRYEVLEAETQAGWIFFQLIEDRPIGTPSPESEVACNILFYGGTQQDVQEPIGPSFHVVFREGWFPHSLAGAQGFAVFNARDGKYYVVLCDQMALCFEAFLDGAMCPAQNATVSTPLPLTFFPFSQTVEIETALNTLMLAGLDADYMFLTWNESVGDFAVSQVQHHEKDFIVAMRYHGCALQKKIQTAAVMICQGESGWEDEISLYPNSYVRATRIVCPLPEAEDQTAKLQDDVQEFCWFTPDEEALPNWVDRHDFIKQETVAGVTDGTTIEFTKVYVWTPCLATADPDELETGPCNTPE